jgi:hypothetical protein
MKKVIVFTCSGSVTDFDPELFLAYLAGKEREVQLMDIDAQIVECLERGLFEAELFLMVERPEIFNGPDIIIPFVTDEVLREASAVNLSIRQAMIEYKRITEESFSELLPDNVKLIYRRELEDPWRKMNRRNFFKATRGENYKAKKISLRNPHCLKS